MTEEQKQDLNPLIIKIKSASCLPSQPVPFHELEVRRARQLMRGLLFTASSPLRVIFYPPIGLPLDVKIIPTSPFRISEQDIKEVGLLGLGASRSWGLPLPHRRPQREAAALPAAGGPGALLGPQGPLPVHQPGLALPFILEVPLPALGGIPVPRFCVLLCFICSLVSLAHILLWLLEKRLNDGSYTWAPSA